MSFPSINNPTFLLKTRPFLYTSMKAAVTELERPVKELGLKGIKMDGTVKGEYLDSKRFWSIFKKAEELGTPIFIHVEDTRLKALKL